MTVAFQARAGSLTAQFDQLERWIARLPAEHRLISPSESLQPSPQPSPQLSPQPSPQQRAGSAGSDAFSNHSSMSRAAKESSATNLGQSTPVRRHFSPRLPASGAKQIEEAKQILRHVEPIVPTWSDVQHGQSKLEVSMKWTVSSNKTLPPPWWKPPQRHTVPNDARRFDDRHQLVVTNAAKALRVSQADPFSSRNSATFEYALDAVRRQRVVGQRLGLAGDFRLGEIKKEPPKKKKMSKWKMVAKPVEPDASIWDPRAKTNDSHALLDTDKCFEQMLSADWDRALRHGVGEYIQSVDDEGDEGEIEETRLALLSHVKLVYSAWDYLCALGGGSVLSIGSNSFAAFIKEAKLADSSSFNCKQSHLDQLFILINNLKERPSRQEASDASTKPRAAAKASAADAAKEKALAKFGIGGVRTFERHEWLHALVRIAIMRYVLPGERSVKRHEDVSGALQVSLPRARVQHALCITPARDCHAQALLMNDIEANLPGYLAQDSNQFRLNVCYTKHCDLLLRGYESSLKAIFTSYAEEREMNPGHIADPTRISYEEWIDFCKHTAILDAGRLHVFTGCGPFALRSTKTSMLDKLTHSNVCSIHGRADVTERSATLAFIWTKMKVRRFSSPQLMTCAPRQKR